MTTRTSVKHLPDAEIVPHYSELKLCEPAGCLYNVAKAFMALSKKPVNEAQGKFWRVVENQARFKFYESVLAGEDYSYRQHDALQNCCWSHIPSGQNSMPRHIASVYIGLRLEDVKWNLRKSRHSEIRRCYDTIESMLRVEI